MESYELDKIARVSNENEELRYLVAQHGQYESELSKWDGIRNPSDHERRLISHIKRTKLKGKDRIREILNKYG